MKCLHCGYDDHDTGNMAHVCGGVIVDWPVTRTWAPIPPADKILEEIAALKHDLHNHMNIASAEAGLVTELSGTVAKLKAELQEARTATLKEAVKTIQFMIDSHKRDTEQCDEFCDIVEGMEAVREALEELQMDKDEK